MEKNNFYIYDHKCILREASSSEDGYRYCLFEEFGTDLFLIECPQVKRKLSYGDVFNVNFTGESSRNGETIFTVYKYCVDWESGYIDISFNVENDNSKNITFRTKSEEVAKKFYIGQKLYGFIDFM